MEVTPPAARQVQHGLAQGHRLVDKVGQRRLPVLGIKRGRAIMQAAHGRILPDPRFQARNTAPCREEQTHRPQNTQF